MEGWTHTLVVAAAGKGARFARGQKLLAPVHGRPLVYYAIAQWLRFVEVQHLVVVVGGDDAAEADAIRGVACRLARERGIKECTFVVQSHPRGIADALSQAAPAIKEHRFVFSLGDCVQRGMWHWRHVPAMDVSFVAQGACKAPRELCEGPLLLCDGQHRVVESIEKPDAWVGMGTYFLDRDTFALLPLLPVSERGELEITDLMQAEAKRRAVAVVPFTGTYVNVTRPSDLREVELIAPFIT